jgi:hypothetical protein
MGYADEEILKEKKRLKNEEAKRKSDETIEKEMEASIFDGTIHIFDMPVKFVEREIEELGISIWMPEQFYLFDEELRKLMYPMGNAPTHVYGAQDLPFNVAFNHTSNRIPNEGMREFLKIAVKTMENLGPKTRIIKAEVISKEDINMGNIEFISNAIDMSVYNVMFYISLQGRLLIATINFPNKDRKRLMPIAKEIVESFTILKEDEI